MNNGDRMRYPASRSGFLGGRHPKRLSEICVDYISRQVLARYIDGDNPSFPAAVVARRRSIVPDEAFLLQSDAERLLEKLSVGTALSSSPAIRTSPPSSPNFLAADGLTSAEFESGRRKTVL